MTVNVVIVDDDARFRQLATALLARHGCVAVAAMPDAESGLAAARQLNPHGMLLDVNLPDQDGLAVAQALREAGQGVRVVLTSTEPMPWSQEELAQAGVRAFVPKEKLLSADLFTLFTG
ncbi:response regulator [Actinocorallia aurea]